MTRLEQLIKKLCPNGVKYKKIKDAYQRLKGTPITAAKMKEISNENGEIKVFAGGKTLINANEKDIPNANITRVPAALVQSRGIIDVVYYDKPFTFKNEMWAYTSPDAISVKYLYYVLKNNINYFRDAASGMGSLPQISLPVTEELKIPVPPLPIQAEIVRILDNFTELTAELTAELMARKKQYEYYRDRILYFDNNVSFVTLGEVADVTKLAGFEFTSHIKYKDDGTIIALRGLNVKDGKLDLSNVKYIDDSNFDKLNRSKLYKGDMLFTYVGTIGQVAVIYEDNKFYLAPNVARIRLNSKIINSEFMRFYFQTNHFFSKQINKFLNSSSMKNLTMENIRKFIIPIPSIEQQNKLVEILSRFDRICNDISEGLPAEISARQKQYEYYRDKLLTFSEIGVR